ncbi:MAG: pentapeptide repeat-containing protein, partial [Rhodoplanes sp.]
MHPGVAKFNQAVFGHKANFSGASFGNAANFAGAIFGERADFRGATFGHAANLSGATFSHHADFYGATFWNWANLSGTHFGEWANFSGATFGNNANLSGAVLSDLANLFGAVFGHGTDFSYATFGPGAGISGAIFGNFTKFTAATFRGSVSFNAWSREEWLQHRTSSMEIIDAGRNWLQERKLQFLAVPEVLSRFGAAPDSLLEATFSCVRFASGADFSGRKFVRRLESLTERFVVQMSQVLEHEHEPIYSPARDIGETMAYQTLQVRRCCI